MTELIDILKAVYNNNPTLKSFLRVVQFFTKSPNKLGIVWKEENGWVLPLDKVKLKIKPDANDLADYMRISRNETYKEDFDFVMIFADKPLNILRDAREMIQFFIRYLINMALMERLTAQQEQTIYRITRYVKVPLIELFEKLDSIEPEYKETRMPQSSIIIGTGRHDASRESASRESANRESVSRESASRESASRETANRELANRESASRKQVGAVLEIANNLVDIVEMSRIDLGKAKIAEVEIQIKDLIDEVVSIIKEKHTRASVIVNIEETVPPCLIGDEKRIKQILFNIWSNCISSLETDVRSSSKKRGLSIEVDAILVDPKSEGIVSSSVESQYYLVSFQINDFRSRNLLKSVFENNLSMNLCTKLIDLLGGNLHFEEQPEGTSIVVEMILLVDKIYEVRYNTLRIAQLKKVILIADDCDPQKINEIKTVLDDHKIKYTYASTTLEANILYSDITFDLYIAKYWNSNIAKHLPINQYRNKFQILDMLKY